MRWEPTLYFSYTRHFSVILDPHNYSLRYILLSPFFRWENRIPEILHALLDLIRNEVALSHSNLSWLYFRVTHHNIFPKTALYTLCYRNHTSFLEAFESEISARPPPLKWKGHGLRGLETKLPILTRLLWKPVSFLFEIYIQKFIQLTKYLPYK